ncbi:unnamed protein product [Aphanomyces euteiches]
METDEKRVTCRPVIDKAHMISSFSIKPRMEKRWTKMVGNMKLLSFDVKSKGRRLLSGMGQAKEIISNAIHTPHLTVESMATYLKLGLVEMIEMDCQFIQMVGTMTDSELMDRLSQYNIVSPPSTVPSRDAMTQILFIVKEESFWRENYHIHPNAQRVRPWLVTHQIVLEKMKRIRSTIAALKGLDRTLHPRQTSNLIQSLITDFPTLVSLLQQHSKAEIEHIFRPMSRHFTADIGSLDHILHATIDSYYPDEIQKCLDELARFLLPDDANGLDSPTTTSRTSVSSVDNDEKEITVVLSPTRSGYFEPIPHKELDTVEQYLDIYFQRVENEMLAEETAIVARWLTLAKPVHQEIVSKLPSVVYPRRLLWQ